MYGEGWSGGTTQLVPENSALKANGPKFGKSQVYLQRMRLVILMVRKI